MLHDLPELKRWINENTPYPISRALVCGLCLTYSSSFLAVVVSNPIVSWKPPLRVPLPIFMENLLHFFASWMIIGFGAIAFRYLFVVIQELVDYEMYVMNKHFHPLKDEGRDYSH